MALPTIITWVIVLNCTCPNDNMVCMRPKGFKQPLFCVNNKISNNFNTYLTDPFKNISFNNINSSADNATTTNFNNNNFTNNYLFIEFGFKSFIILNQVKIKN